MEPLSKASCFKIPAAARVYFLPSTKGQGPSPLLGPPRGYQHSLQVVWHPRHPLLKVFAIFYLTAKCECPKMQQSCFAAGTLGRYLHMCVRWLCILFRYCTTQSGRAKIILRHYCSCSWAEMEWMSMYWQEKSPRVFFLFSFFKITQLTIRVQTMKPSI